MDIAPELINRIRQDFEGRMKFSPIIRAIAPKIEDGTATYEDAMRYATEVGNLRAKAIKNQVYSGILPNGQMYYNIAERVINDSLSTDYETIQPICNVAQTNKNKSLNLGVKVIDEEIDQDNIDNIVSMVGVTEDYDSKSKLFETACATFAKTVVDRNMKANAFFQRKLGIKLVINRVAGAGCCDWCSGLSGVYDIDNAPDEVWGHHNGCMCSVDYDKK